MGSLQSRACSSCGELACLSGGGQDKATYDGQSAAASLLANVGASLDELGDVGGDLLG